MVSEIEIKVSESGTLTEIGSIGFQFRDNEHLFIYLFIYLFIVVGMDYLIYYCSINMRSCNSKLPPKDVLKNKLLKKLFCTVAALQLWSRKLVNK